jgi:hypothetical protein
MTNIVETATNLVNGTNSFGGGSAPPPIKEWMVIVACVFGGLTLLFLMLLVLLEVLFNKNLKRETRFLVVSIIAFGLALSGGFLGSSGQLSGSLPLPQALQNPLTFGMTGGAAVFAVVWIIGYWLYVRKAPIPPYEISVDYPKGTNLADAIRIAATKGKQKYGVVFKPDEAPFRECIVAEGEITAESAVELIDMLKEHLAQESKPIQYTTTKPENQELITVTHQVA